MVGGAPPWMVAFHRKKMRKGWYNSGWHMVTWCNMVLFWDKASSSGHIFRVWRYHHVSYLFRVWVKNGGLSPWFVWIQSPPKHQFCGRNTFSHQKTIKNPQGLVPSSVIHDFGKTTCNFQPYSYRSHGSSMDSMDVRVQQPIINNSLLKPYLFIMIY